MKTEKMLELFDIKKIQTYQGREGNTLYCDVYFKRKKVAVFVDPADGGETQITFVEDNIKKEIESFFMQSGLNQDIYANEGWDFLENVDKLSFLTMFEIIVDKVFNKKVAIKEEKKWKAKCKKSLVYREGNSYHEVSWKSIKDLEELLKYNNGLEVLQKAYDEGSKEGNTIINDVEQLKKLGITLSPSI